VDPRAVLDTAVTKGGIFAYRDPNPGHEDRSQSVTRLMRNWFARIKCSVSHGAAGTTCEVFSSCSSMEDE